MYIMRTYVLYFKIRRVVRNTREAERYHGADFLVTAIEAVTITHEHRIPHVSG